MFFFARAAWYCLSPALAHPLLHPPSLLLTSRMKKCVDNNNLVGTLPNELSHLISLTALSLKRNSLAWGPAPLIFHDGLRRLQLGDNNLSGTLDGLIDGLASISSTIRVIELQDNRLGGGVPESLGMLKGLSE